MNGHSDLPDIPTVWRKLEDVYQTHPTNPVKNMTNTPVESISKGTPLRQAVEKVARLRMASRPWSEYVPRKKETPAENVLVQGDFRTQVIVPGPERELRDVALEMGKLLGDCGLYLRAGQAWHFCKKERRLVPMDSKKFMSWMQDHLRCADFVGRGEDRRLATVTMTDACAQSILKSTHFLDELPEIKRVIPVKVPILRPAGKVELLPCGYDKESGVLVLNEAEVFEMPIAEARDYLRDLLSDFPFEKSQEEQMRSNALAGMLAVYCDLLLPPNVPRPVWLSSANAEGAGKTTQTRVSIVPVYGPMRVTPPPDAGNSEELKKLLFSAVLAAEPYVVFDNWRGKVGGPTLEAFATSTVWSDRILGRSEKISMEKNVLLFITANDAVVLPDMRRRCISVELFIEEARAEDRKVRRVIDEDFIMAERSNILSALWAIVRDWAALGCVKSAVQNLSFPAWSASIGGILENMDMMSPAVAVQTKRGGDEDLVDFDKMLVELMTTLPTGDGINFVSRDRCEIKSAPLLSFAREYGFFDSVLSEEEPTTDRDKRKERAIFAKICKRFEGRVLLCGWRFSVSDHVSRSWRHYIIAH